MALTPAADGKAFHELVKKLATEERSLRGALIERDRAVEQIAPMIAHLRANVGFGEPGGTDEDWARYIVAHLTTPLAEVT